MYCNTPIKTDGIITQAVDTATRIAIYFAVHTETYAATYNATVPHPQRRGSHCRCNTVDAVDNSTHTETYLVQRVRCQGIAHSDSQGIADGVLLQFVLQFDTH